ncbi:MAG: hypothetical protein HEQ39_15385 [Rhizobacter sp.]
MSTSTGSRPVTALITPTPRRHFWIAVGAACALHSVLLLIASQAQPEKPLAAPVQRLQWRWVQPAVLPVPTMKHAPSAQEPSSPTHTRQARTKTAAAQDGSLPSAVSTNASASAATSLSSDVSIPTESNNQAPSQPALQLQLPASPPSRASTRTMLGQALNDARSNSRRTTLEDRIAQVTTGNDALQVDVLGEGRKRVHLNGRCLDVHQARISQIDPMNEVSQRAMPGVKRCDQ